MKTAHTPHFMLPLCLSVRHLLLLLCHGTLVPSSHGGRGECFSLTLGGRASWGSLGALGVCPLEGAGFIRAIARIFPREVQRWNFVAGSVPMWQESIKSCPSSK